MFVRHYVAAGCDARIQFSLQRLGRGVRHHLCSQLAIALHDTHDGNLVRAALAARRALVGMLVLLLAANVCLVGLDHALKRLVESLGAGRVAQATQQEPSGLLRDLEVFRELGGCDPLGVARHHPDRHEPLAKWQFRVLEDRADLNGETLPAIAALMGAIVREVVNLGAATARAIRAIFPADGLKMVDADLLVAEHFHHLH